MQHNRNSDPRNICPGTRTCSALVVQNLLGFRSECPDLDWPVFQLSFDVSSGHMPFSIKLHLGAEKPVIFDCWLEDGFGRFIKEGTPFARAVSPDGSGVIVTSGPMFLSSRAPLVRGCSIDPGEYVASGAADGEDIPYGKPYCVFVLGNHQ